ncbi:hypothetical protein GGQ08_001345 [Salinibacter ruber]|nr:hypothetical protein [Salinibacter ruber]MCS3650052.1 hypothetical protein [Salinibacter ruber]MCS3653305.1 hypothetical protein [Salinibacter ruber]MCS3656455.1 hypothetical protein [Salinibacter ruber]MCS3685129.1 hypothetical protein [Salinibacter ruber]
MIRPLWLVSRSGLPSFPIPLSAWLEGYSAAHRHEQND